MTPYLILLLAIVVNGLLATLLIFWAIRGEEVHRCRVTIICAISRYKLANTHLFGKYEVDYSDMRSYKAIYARFWDWGYTNILPPDKFAIIKPYLAKGEAYGVEP